MLGEDERLEPRVEPVIEGVLGLDRADEEGLPARPLDLVRDDEVLAERDVPLRFLGERHQPEALDLLDGQTADADDVEVEDGVLGDGVVAHLEDDGPVRPPGPVDLGPGRGPELVDRPRVARDAGVGRGQRLGRDVLAGGRVLLELVEHGAVDVVPGQNDSHGVPTLESAADIVNNAKTALARPGICPKPSLMAPFRVP